VTGGKRGDCRIARAPRQGHDTTEHADKKVKLTRFAIHVRAG
jgi:hypothetical protein